MDRISSVQEIFQNIDQGFEPARAEGVDAIFQFVLTGDEGGEYWSQVNDQQADVQQGVHPNPTMTMTATAEDYLAIVNGEMNAMTAFMQGKVKVKGDMGLALKLQSMFGLT
jgi:putative sterol carrier protein